MHALRRRYGRATGEGPRTALLRAVRKDNVHAARSRWGDCELVSDEFLFEARDRRMAYEHDSYIVLGYRAYDPKFAARRGIERKEGEHQWVVIAGSIYDGTSDQFSDSECTVTQESDPRYRERSRMPYTFHKARASTTAA